MHDKRKAPINSSNTVASGPYCSLLLSQVLGSIWVQTIHLWRHKDALLKLVLEGLFCKFENKVSTVLALHDIDHNYIVRSSKKENFDYAN
jgi:hypothetical protein